MFRDSWTDISRDRLERTFHVNILAYMSVAAKAVKHMGKVGTSASTGNHHCIYELVCTLPTELCSFAMAGHCHHQHLLHSGFSANARHPGLRYH